MTREEAIRILASSCIPGSKQTEALETLIPELSESEDERIRKAIIHYILYETKGAISEATEHAWVKWLEKQKEQKPWSEEDEKIIGRLRSVVNECASYNYALDVNGDYCEGDYAKLDSWLKSLPLNLKKKNEDVAKLCSKEWSEEDEDRIRQIERIAQKAECTEKLQEEIHDWLRSLRNRLVN